MQVKSFCYGTFLWHYENILELCRLTVNCFLENLNDILIIINDILIIIKFKMAFSSFEIMGRGQFFTESW